jgi:uncharacterized protein
LADQAIIDSIRRYLHSLVGFGIEPSFGVLFGSYANGRATEWSDIDLIVAAKHFDGNYIHEDVSKLWIAAGRIDNRIEPIPCGERQWEEDDETPIYEIARKEGIVVRMEN